MECISDRAYATREALAEDVVRVLFGDERLLLNPDCGFTTFADNPVTAAAIAEAKLSAIVAARDSLG